MTILEQITSNKWYTLNIHYRYPFNSLLILSIQMFRVYYFMLDYLSTVACNCFFSFHFLRLNYSLTLFVGESLMKFFNVMKHFLELDFTLIFFLSPSHIYTQTHFHHDKRFYGRKGDEVCEERRKNRATSVLQLSGCFRYFCVHS